VIKFARFADHRGYFSELFRHSELFHLPETFFLHGCEFLQSNESYSLKNTIRGLHFQWNPFVGKLVRTVAGRMIDLALDVRKKSPTFGKIIAYDMPTNPEGSYGEWIWVPPGFAHGNFFTTNSLIEYHCSGEYAPEFEIGISPFANDIDWSICDPHLKEEFNQITSPLITEKDKYGMALSDWKNDDRASFF